MSLQRTRLAKYENKKQYYHATFGEIRHDKDNIAHVLLKDIYPVYENGKKIPLRSKPPLLNKKGQQIAADHVWVELVPSFFDVNQELLYGDEITFSAVVQSYNISRSDVKDNRHAIWKNGQDESQKVYDEYRKFCKTELERKFIEMQNKSNNVFYAYKKHLLTYPEMQKEQSRLMKEFKKEKNKAYRSMQAKQKRRLDNASKKINDVKLIDYSFSNIQNVKCLKRITKFNKYRTYYDKTRINDLSYTKFLSAHSMAARKDDLENWK